MQTENKKGFQVKDLIVTALLSLCALVIYIICAFLSFSPYTLVVSPLWSLLAAITYFLVAAKTKKPWALFIFCAVTGIYGHLCEGKVQQAGATGRSFKRSLCRMGWR